MVALGIIMLSLILITLVLFVVKAQTHAWTLEALRLLWTMTILVGLLLLMSISLITST